METKNFTPSPAEAADTIIEQQVPLSDAEQKELTDCEKRVASGNVEKAMALKTIHDGKLFRANFHTWEEYVTERWGYCKSYSHQVLKFAAMCEMIETAKKSADGRLLVMPSSERQVRPLASLADDTQQLMAWSLAMDQAGGKTPSGMQVEQAVSTVRKNERKPRKPKRSVAQASEAAEATGVDEAERREDTLNADCDASMNVSDDVIRQDANDSNQPNGTGDASIPDVAPATETGDGNRSMQPMQEQDTQDNRGRVGGTAEGCVGEASSELGVTATANDKPAEPQEPVKTSPLRKASGQASRAEELAEACRIAVANDVDEDVAEAIYSAVRKIVEQSLLSMAA